MATVVQTRVTVARSQVAERVQRYFELSLFAMVVTGFVSLAGTGRLDALSVLFVLAALGGRAFLSAPGRPAMIPTAITSKLTIAYVAFYFLDLFFISGTFIGPLVHLVLFV